MPHHGQSLMLSRLLLSLLWLRDIPVGVSIVVVVVAVVAAACVAVVVVVAIAVVTVVAAVARGTSRVIHFVRSLIYTALPY